MPRVKWIYIGDGEWIAPTADIRTCPHPRDRLRFDSRFALPVAVYCMACGKPYLHPFHGLTEEQIAAHIERVEQKYGHWFKDEESHSGSGS